MSARVDSNKAGCAPKMPVIAPISVAFLLFNGFQPIDMTGPWQAFCTANEELGRPFYRLETLGWTATVLSADGGLCVHVGTVIGDVALPVDMLIVPGGPGVHQLNQQAATSAWLREMDRSTQRTCSVCTGAFVLAAAGLLDGCRVTTHWRSAQQLRLSYPQLRVNDELIYCESGKYWTTAGVTAGIDLALALIERDCGADVALRVARRLVVYLRRDGDQRQFSQMLRLQDRAAAPFRELISQLEGSLEQDWPVDRMAERCGMSRRSFQRKFTESFGMSPVAALSSLRLEHAQLLTRAGSLSRKAIAREVGLQELPPQEAS